MILSVANLAFQVFEFSNQLNNLPTLIIRQLIQFSETDNSPTPIILNSDSSLTRIICPLG